MRTVRVQFDWRVNVFFIDFYEDDNHRGTIVTNDLNEAKEWLKGDTDKLPE